MNAVRLRRDKVDCPHCGTPLVRMGEADFRATLACPNCGAFSEV